MPGGIFFEIFSILVDIIHWLNNSLQEEEIIDRGRDSVTGRFLLTWGGEGDDPRKADLRPLAREGFALQSNSAEFASGRASPPSRFRPSNPAFRHQQKNDPQGSSLLMAEREGFEPSGPLRDQHISSVSHSTTLAPLHVVKDI